MRLLRLLRKLPTLSNLSTSQLRDLGSAQVAILKAHQKVRSRPLGELVVVSDDETRIGRQDPEASRRVAWAVKVTARSGLTRPQCLVRSLAIQQMLRDRGLPPGEIKIGVRWEDDEFLAHAWVEQDGKVLGDTRRNVSTFEPVTDMRLVQF